ncbi:MAG: DNA recombination protein RmuC, partial [Pseudomonadota bacterium]|nr:DNA recombination protein RmuC [Pseudomonadota bacterium]
MDPLILILILLVPFGIALGWYLGNRPAAAFRKERDERLDDFRRAIADLAVAEERAKQVPTLQAQLEEVRQA